MGKTVHYKLLDIDYLGNKELTEDDLRQVFDYHIFNKSCIIELFRMTGDKRQPMDIIKYCKENQNWVDTKIISQQQYDSFIVKLSKAYKNIWHYSDIVSLRLSQQWMNIYGFRVNWKNKTNK